MKWARQVNLCVCIRLSRQNVKWEQNRHNLGGFYPSGGTSYKGENKAVAGEIREDQEIVNQLSQETFKKRRIES